MIDYNLYGWWRENDSNTPAVIHLPPGARHLKPKLRKYGCVMFGPFILSHSSLYDNV